MIFQFLRNKVVFHQASSLFQGHTFHLAVIYTYFEVQKFEALSWMSWTYGAANCSQDW